MGHRLIVRTWKWIVLSLIFWLIILKCIPAEFCDLGGDSAQYIILAESLIKGTGLRLVNYPQEPFSFYFPPLLSFLLSPVIYFFGRHFYLMHIVIAFLGFLSLYFFYQIFKHFSDRLTAALCVFLLATNWAFIIYSAEYILSEIPYLFFSSFTLFMAVRYTRECSFLNRSAFFVICGVLLSYFTRHSGFVLFLSIIAFFFFSRHKDKIRKIFLIAGVFLLVFAAWNVLEHLNSERLTSHSRLFFLIDPYLPDKGTIFSHPLQLANRFIAGINRVFVLLGDISFFYFLKKGAVLNDLLCLLVMIFVVSGLWIKFRQDRHCVLHYYFLSYLFLLFLWIFYDFIEGIRYLMPVLPFVIFYFLAGFLRVLKLVSGGLYRVLLPVSMSIFFFFNLMNVTAIPKGYQLNINSLSAPFKNFVLLHGWINKNLSDQEVILSRKPAITFLYSNHKSVGFPYTSDDGKIWDQVLKDGVKYIIVDEFSRETYYFLSPVLYKHRDRLKLLYRIGDTGLFERLI